MVISDKERKITLLETEGGKAPFMGEDKDSQKTDIKRAQELWKEYKDDIERHRKQLAV